MNDTDPIRNDPPSGTTAPARPGTEATSRPEEETSELARHADPSQTSTTKVPATTTTEKSRPGVLWVRPSELASMASARAAGRGIDLHAELARRARRPVVQAAATSRRAISERARRLPPLAAFGRSTRPFTGTTRSGLWLR